MNAVLNKAQRKSLGNNKDSPRDRPDITIGLLRRLFVGPFYKQHASTFLFLYVLFMGSFLFINYLGEIPSSESFLWHFILMIFMVTEQFMVLLFLVLCTFYIFKTRLFVKLLLVDERYGFLNQSMATCTRRRQWWLWFRLELLLSLPLLIYGIACLIMSLFKGQVIFGVVILCYLLAAVMVVSSLNFRQLIKIPRPQNYDPLFRWRPKANHTPWMASLYSLHMELPALIITKGATILFITLMVFWEKEETMATRQWWLSFLLVGSAHALLVFRISRFMEVRFKDFWGLPLTVIQGFLFAIGRWYLLLVLPECFILIAAGFIYYALTGLLSTFCLLIFYHYFSVYLQFNLKFLLKAGFLLLFVAFVLTLYGLFWLVILACIIMAFIIYRSNYYCRQ